MNIKRSNSTNPTKANKQAAWKWHSRPMWPEVPCGDTSARIGAGSCVGPFTHESLATSTGKRSFRGSNEVLAGGAHALRGRSRNCSSTVSPQIR